jgi:hypothetical protein
MIWSRYSVLSWGSALVDMHAAANSFDEFLDGNTVFIEHGNYLLHNEIDLKRIEQAIEKGYALAADLELRNFSIPLVEDTKRVGVNRLKQATYENLKRLKKMLEIDFTPGRFTRAIELFGDILHAIAGTPTGAQWRENARLVNQLKEAMEGQTNLDRTLVKSLKENTRHLLDLSEVDVTLAQKIAGINGEIVGFAHLSRIVEAGLDNQRIIRDRLTAIQFILQDSKMGRLSTLLIESNDLAKEIEELTGVVNRKGLYPAFGPNDLHYIYNLKNTLTFIKGGKIHSASAYGRRLHGVHIPRTNVTLHEEEEILLMRCQGS